MNPLRTGPWKIAEVADVKPNGKKVFSCFHCGGGSSMGYKLAGYEVLGGVEIDEEIIAIYRKNHHPKHSYLMGVKEFNLIPDSEIPKELFELDVLDGSPPCSTFSMAGSREGKWGKETHFREGQSVQILDDLFFHFIETANKLKPKVVVAENVTGLIKGNAKGYVKEIFKALDKAGYDVQLFLLNSARMGVPQRRERTFFIAKRKDLKLSKIDLKFNEPLIPVKQAWVGLPPQQANALEGETLRLWTIAEPGQSMAEIENRGIGFNNIKISWNEPSSTIATAGSLYHPVEPRRVSGMEVVRLQTFPDDYDFTPVGARYVCGMSVPPFMMQRVANQIYEQWLSKI